MVSSKQKHKEAVLRALGESVRQARIGKKMTQEQLAIATEVHRTYITDIESGVRNLSFMTLHKLCRALECPLSRMILAAEDIDGWGTLNVNEYGPDAHQRVLRPLQARHSERRPKSPEIPSNRSPAASVNIFGQ